MQCSAIFKSIICNIYPQGWDVHATVRKESDMSVMPGAAAGYILDVTNKGQIGDLAARFVERPVDLLVFNAGVGKGTPEDVMMEVNVNAPFNVINALLPSVLASEQKKITIMSSQLGSREKYGGGETPSNPYGASKCFLNDRFRQEEEVWRKNGVSALVIHPGWVITDMGGQGANISVEESVAGMYNVLQELSSTNSGSFLTYQGIIHPW